MTIYELNRWCKMADGDPFQTRQNGANPLVAAELEDVGFSDVEEIGRGGFGVVYRCAQPNLDRMVAVKVLTANVDEENRRRFLREQRAMGRLTGHPNIVGVLQVGSIQSGQPYIVMQYHSRGSLEARIRRQGPLTVNETLRLGVKLSDALETAHRSGILHRDVKPANILFTQFGEPVLADFGLAHIQGGFETNADVVTGSPAFTAPEVLSGQAPSVASDIYSLGATLFCSITGHAAFERRSGERVVAQFVRITTEALPDLREHGLPDELCGVIERAMSRTSAERHISAQEFGSELHSIEVLRGVPNEDTDLDAKPETGRPVHSKFSLEALNTPLRAGNLPLELTSFIGRRRELAETKSLLVRHRLVTLTGIGGVGKTRLALRAGDAERRAYPDGVWLIELGNLADQTLVTSLVAAALGLRKSPLSPEDMLVAFLRSRQALLILDNCEHLVDAVAELAENLLRACSRVRILATSREVLGVNGEGVLRVPPLRLPDPGHTPSLQGLPQYEALTLFAERAAIVVPSFELTDQNRVAAAQVCQRLEGLPLPIELAAARLRAMSLEQILTRLANRYDLLTRGSRRMPSRQQTLRLCVDWSYELCSTREQLVWSRLSIFSETTELDAAEQVCGEGMDTEEFLDTLTSLVEKSILIREEQNTTVRFRLLETLRDYGCEKACETGEYPNLRKLHRDWYEQLVLDAEADWISERQLGWIARLDREQPNIREALEFCAADSPTDGARMASALYSFWSVRGLYREGRRWFARFLPHHDRLTVADHAKALEAACVLAELQGDIKGARNVLQDGLALIGETTEPVARSYLDHAEASLAFFTGDLPQACRLFERSLTVPHRTGHDAMQVEALTFLGMSYDLLGDTARATAQYQHALEFTELHGESSGRVYALWGMAVLLWRQKDLGGAKELLRGGIRLARLADDPVATAICLETLAWIEGSGGFPQRAAVLMGAADAVATAVGGSPTFFPQLSGHHDRCVAESRQSIGEKGYASAHKKGGDMDCEEAAAYAMGFQVQKSPPDQPDLYRQLTKREQQVAHLVAEGLTNKAIAGRLVISPRTAQGHVEHVLTKLGFSSRAQIAAWVADRRGQA
ncbi:protein kinase [Rhodococcus qingshengii]|uniref:protein kinase domain-containing protein n=1 Tax=Rhodococcus qingshengii TaxID=334542 RepID=UPI0036DEE8B9